MHEKLQIILNDIKKYNSNLKLITIVAYKNSIPSNYLLQRKTIKIQWKRLIIWGS